MLPKSTGNVLPGRITEVRRASKTYGMDMVNKRISGYVDGLDAVHQAVYGILSAERYEHLVYGWNYGVELRDLYGRSMPYVKSEIKRRICEALLQDDRINGVEDFVFTQDRGKLTASFTVKTVYGEVKEEKEVTV